MRLPVMQLIAAVLAAACLLIAFFAARSAVVSGVFMVLALAALGFIAWTALRRAFGRRRANR
jgi:hypothetical protein